VIFAELCKPSARHHRQTARAIIAGADADNPVRFRQRHRRGRPGCHCLLCVSFLSPDMPLISAQKFSLCRLAK